MFRRLTPFLAVAALLLPLAPVEASGSETAFQLTFTGSVQYGGGDVGAVTIVAPPPAGLYVGCHAAGVIEGQALSSPDPILNPLGNCHLALEGVASAASRDDLLGFSKSLVSGWCLESGDVGPEVGEPWPNDSLQIEDHGIFPMSLAWDSAGVGLAESRGVIPVRGTVTVDGEELQATGTLAIVQQVDWCWSWRIAGTLTVA